MAHSSRSPSNAISSSSTTSIMSSISLWRYLGLSYLSHHDFFASVISSTLLPTNHLQRTLRYVVSHFSGLATSACSLALQIGKGPRTALEVLEQGREVILSLFIDGRSDTSKLKAAYPQLCKQYESLRLEVNKPAENITDDRTRRTASTRRIVLENKPATISRDETCGRNLLAGI